LRHFKKLTRTQRNLLIDAGYREDLHNLYYVMDEGKDLQFVTSEGKKLLYNKELKEVREE
jgi:hypothetical protein